MKAVNEVDLFCKCKYYKIIKKIINDNKAFSLVEQYKDSSNTEGSFQLNGVSVITPSQTISRYNLKPSHEYYHKDSFNEIMNGVYGHNFGDDLSGQDIKIRFINISYKGASAKSMTIEVPIPINSSQKMSLINLNNSLKELRKFGIEVSIESSIAQKNGDFYYFDNKSEDLGTLLDNLIIDDSVDYKYKELFLIGDDNLKSEFIKTKKK